MNDNWIQQPSKTTLLLFTVGWIVGSILLLLAVTNLFQEPLFASKNILVLFLIIVSGISTFYIYQKYRSSKPGQ